MKLPSTFKHTLKTPVVLAGAAVIVFYTSYLTQIFYSQLSIKPWHQNINKEIESLARAQATKIDLYFKALDEKLNEVAQDSTLFALMKAENTARITEFHSLLRHQLPEMAEIKLVTTNSPYFSETSNFVGITLAKNSIDGKQPEATAVKLHDWLIVKATPITQGGEITGSLIVNLSVQYLHTLLSAADPALGKTELLQYTRGFEPQAIVSTGYSNTAFQGLVPIAGRADWKIRYSASAKLIDTLSKPFFYFSLAFISLLIVGVLLFILLVRYQLNRIKSDFALDENDLSPEELNQLIEEKLTKRTTLSNSVEIASDLPKIDNDTPLLEVFRQYDIRGKANSQISENFALRLGKSIGSDLLKTGQANLLVGTDGRSSSPMLKSALIKGVLSTGCNVIDIGLVPTPVLNFALLSLNIADSGVMITASHNPAPDNGFKIYYNKQVVSGAEIIALKTAMDAGLWSIGQGLLETLDTTHEYSNAITRNIARGSQQLRVVVDCANGAASLIAPALLEALGCEVIPLYCEIDGTFPNHPPDPSSPDNLTDLITVVKHEGADLGLAFDGDGDRLVAISAAGKIVWPDELLMIFARDIIARYPETDIIFDVKSTQRLGPLISNYGGHPVMWKTGHSNMRRKIAETNAPLGGEFSGHIFFNDRWLGFDDGIYTAARLVEIIGQREQSLDEIIAGFEVSISTPELRISVPEQQKFALVDKFSEGIFPDAKRITIDGLRLEYADGWALVRASNTSAHLTLRFEANDQQALSRIQHKIKLKLLALLPDTKLPF